MTMVDTRTFDIINGYTFDTVGLLELSNTQLKRGKSTYVYKKVKSTKICPIGDTNKPEFVR